MYITTYSHFVFLETKVKRNRGRFFFVILAPESLILCIYMYIIKGENERKRKMENFMFLGICAGVLKRAAENFRQMKPGYAG